MKKELLIILFSSTAILINSQTKISLDGQWQFTPDSNIVLNINNIDNHQEWIEAEVPGSWHLYNNVLLDYQGIGWFKKYFTLDVIDTSKRYIIHFDAVDYLAEITVNKQSVGQHEGGYTPFEFDITRLIKEGENELLAKVNDPEATEEGTEGISYWNIPHGKQNWYVQTSGIWQPVYLKVKEKEFIKNVFVTPKISGSFTINLNLNLTLNRTRNRTHTRNVSVKIISPGNKTVFEKSVSFTNEEELNIEGKIDNPLLWDLYNPNLYTVNVKLGNDEYEEKFGFREFTKRDGKFYLNNKPFYMIAALDQNFYPETVYKSPSVNYMLDEMIKAKQLGINTLRCHIKIPEKEYLELADQLGLLVWYEIPNWDVFDESVKSRARKTFDAMLDRDWNHPSLVVISLINESWGIDLSQTDQRKWLLDEFNYAKEKAIDRLIVDNSACWGNFHIKTDINDYHIYWAIPENYTNFENQVITINQRPDWLFSKYGDSKETGDEVLMISEFGNWGLPKLPAELPFWWDRQFYDDWITLPAGVERRFADFKYNRIFNSYDKLAEESQKAQTKALKYEIEEIRLAENIQGYCITEMTDINWEVNGLLDMWRNYKHNKNVLPVIQNQDVIIPRTEKFNFYAGEEIPVDIYFSYYSGKDLSDLKLIWNIDNVAPDTIIIDRKFDIADVIKLAEINVPTLKVDKPSEIRIDFELINGDEAIAKNFREVLVYPNLNDTYETGEIIVTNNLDNKILDEVEKGKTALCLADSLSRLAEIFPYKIVSRESDWLDGNWASALNWYNPGHTVFQNLNFGKSFGFEAYEVLPHYVINNIPAEEFEAVNAGLFIGWVHLNSAYMLELKYGKGKILLTTFDLSNQNDPYVQALRKNIFTYINSKEFHPAIDLKLSTGK